MTHRRRRQGARRSTRCASGRSSSTASSPRARCRTPRALPREALLDARRPRAPLARGAAAAPTSRSRSSRASCSSGAGCRSTRSASTCRATSSRRSSCAPCRRRSPASSGSSSARRRRAPASSPPRPRLLGIDEVWALGGPQAIGWLAYVERVDKIVGPGNAYVNEAKLEVSRDVAIDLPGGPSEVVVVASSGADPRIVELELAAQARARPRRGLPRRRDARGGGGARARAPRAARRGRGARRRGAQRRRGLRRPVRRPSPAGDYATGGNHVLPTDGWARSVGGLGLETFLKPVTMQRLTRGGARAHPADGRGARRGRGHARARGGGAAMRALAPEFTRLRAGRRRPTRSRGSPGSTRRRSCASTRTRRRCRCRRRARARSPARSRASTATRPAATRRCVDAIADYAGVEPGEHRARRGRRRPDPALRARVRRAGRHDRDRRRRRRIRSTASPRSSRARRSATTTRCSRSACRPNNPTGALEPLPDARPLVVDEAYFEYCGETARAADRRRRDRAAHVLEGVRARRRARRLRARRRATSPPS